VIVAETPSNATVSCDAMLLKPVPVIVTEEPAAPVLELIEPMLKVLVPAVRVIEVMLPSAS
jgi:hypothetical protein